MPFVDTHAHLYLDKFSDDIDEVVVRARQMGVERILLPNIDLDSIAGLKKLCTDYPGFFYGMMGLHPCDVKSNYRDVLAIMSDELNSGQYVAVGEIGIDLYWDKTTLDIQKDAFRIQCEWAKELDLPVAIHARESFDEIFEVLDTVNDVRLKGVFHCFTGNEVQAKRIMEFGGFMFGIGGVITYPKSDLASVLKSVPLDMLVLETDAPFLSPQPFRSKRNESSYLKFVAEKLASVYNLTIEEIGEATTTNAMALFSRINRN
jgi:TatD DNase family protein